MITRKKDIRRLAYLEALHRELSLEFDNLNKLLQSIGFQEGLTTLKEVAEDMLDEGLDREFEE